MTERADLMTIEEAATLLGLSRQRVNSLIEAGSLTRVARGIVSRASVERYLTSRPGQRRRVWTEATAWAAITLLAGGPVHWLGAPQASRLRGILRDITDPLELVDRTRERAVVQTFSAHSSVLPRIAEDLVRTDPRIVGLMESSKQIDGYLAADRLESYVNLFGLRESTDGNVVLRLTYMDIAIVDDLARVNAIPALLGIDLTSSLDPRERGIGKRILVDVLNEYRDDTRWSPM
jgi:excisionase family DNA binding protein